MDESSGESEGVRQELMRWVEMSVAEAKVASAYHTSRHQILRNCVRPPAGTDLQLCHPAQPGEIERK
jgi:hypothetical protein